MRGIGSRTLIDLYEEYPQLSFDHVEAIVPHLKQKQLQRLIQAEKLNTVRKSTEKLYAQHKAAAITMIPISSIYYPKQLRLIPDPPKILYAKGNLSLLKEHKQVAIIGSRRPTYHGYQTAEKIANLFAEKNYIIVSGLAKGIDTSAHHGALQVEQGKTIAVLAGNLQNITPVENKPLAATIIEKEGLLLSESPIGKHLHRGDFVRRNRIQSGLSLAVCPVQTTMKSGTQHTIEFSRKQERFLFTPSPHQSEMQEEAVEGNLALIQAGTFVMENIELTRELEAEMNKVWERLEQEHDSRFGNKQNCVKQLNLFDS